MEMMMEGGILNTPDPVAHSAYIYNWVSKVFKEFYGYKACCIRDHHGVEPRPENNYLANAAGDSYIGLLCGNNTLFSFIIIKRRYQGYDSWVATFTPIRERECEEIDRQSRKGERNRKSVERMLRKNWKRVYDYVA